MTEAATPPEPTEYPAYHARWGRWIPSLLEHIEQAFFHGEDGLGQQLQAQHAEQVAAEAAAPPDAPPAADAGPPAAADVSATSPAGQPPA